MIKPGLKRVVNNKIKRKLNRNEYMVYDLHMKGYEPEEISRMMDIKTEEVLELKANSLEKVQKIILEEDKGSKGKKSRRGRLNRTDWLDMGLDVLKKKGYDKIKIEPLCEELSVSKGSFYHHFVNIDDYVESLVKHWEKEYTLKNMELADEGASVDEKLNRIQEIQFQNPGRLEAEVRAWSIHHPVVRKYQSKIDKERMDYIINAYIKDGLPKETAKRVAEIEYATYVGLQTLYINKSKKEMIDLYHSFERVLLHHGKKNIK